MSLDISGVVAPVITPINEDRSIAFDRISESVEYTLEHGCHAVIASGTGVQDLPSLSPAERKRDVSEVIRVVEGRVPVIAGVSYPAQPVVDDLIDHAEQEGADGVIAMPPWGASPTQDAIVEYFEAIVDSTDLPVFVYNNPGLSVDMNRETIRRVATLDGIEYIKESGHDWKKIAWIIDQVQHEGLADIFTTMEVFLPTLQAGGAGVVSPAPTTVPCMELYEVYQDQEYENAQELQRRMSVFPPNDAETGGAAIWKAVAEADGFDIGPPRHPHSPVTTADLEALEAWLDTVDAR